MFSYHYNSETDAFLYPIEAFISLTVLASLTGVMSHQVPVYSHSVFKLVLANI